MAQARLRGASRERKVQPVTTTITSATKMIDTPIRAKTVSSKAVARLK